MKSSTLSKIAIGLAFVVSIISFPFLPDTMAIQFGADNLPTNTSPKILGLLLVPGVMVFLHLTRGASRSWIHSANIQDSTFFFTISQYVLLLIHCMAILYNIGFHFNIAAFISILLGIVFIIVGNFLNRAVSGYGHGIKNRWTLSSGIVWKKTHRVSSILFILAGLLVILLNLPGIGYSSSYTGVILASSVLLSYAASYLFYRKHGAKMESE